MKKYLSSILFVIIGILCVVSAVLTEDTLFIPMGICFMALSVTIRIKE